MRKFLALCAAAFRHGYEAARAKAQPPLAGFLGETEDEIKAMLAALIRAAHDEGVAAEKARVSAILTAPGAAMFPDLAADLVRGPATGAQAIAVLARAEADAATRAGLMKSNLLESASADVQTLH
jgi:hypothetical protein